MAKCRCFMASVVASIFLILSSTTFAAPVVKHEVTVSKYGDGDFTTISAALASINDASSTNKYVVRVKPGIYAESVTMIQYVDLIGSGQTNTILSSISTAPDFTISTADNSSIESIALTTSGSPDQIVYIPTTTFSARLKNVKIIMPSNDYAYGIHGGSTSTTLEFLNSEMELTAGSTSSSDMGIYVNGKIVVRDSTFYWDTLCIGVSSIIYAQTGDVVLSNVIMKLSSAGGLLAVFSDTDATTQIFNTKIEATQGIYPYHLLEGNNSTFIIDNSAIRVTSSPNSYSYAGLTANTVTISNSVIESGDIGVRVDTGAKPDAMLNIKNSTIIGQTVGVLKQGGSFRIGNSQLVGGHNGEPGIDKVINCFDESYNPVPSP